jgi:hypothetical protein
MTGGHKAEDRAMTRFMPIVMALGLMLGGVCKSSGAGLDCSSPAPGEDITAQYGLTAWGEATMDLSVVYLIDQADPSNVFYDEGHVWDLGSGIWAAFFDTLPPGTYTLFAATPMDAIEIPDLTVRP